jgi:hypothetical protein
MQDMGEKCGIDLNLNSWEVHSEYDISYPKIILCASHRETSAILLLCFLDKGTEYAASTIHDFAWKSLFI